MDQLLQASRKQGLASSSVPPASPPPASEPPASSLSDVVPLGHTAYAEGGYEGAPLPDNEAQRIKTLSALKVLVSGGWGADVTSPGHSHLAHPCMPRSKVTDWDLECSVKGLHVTFGGVHFT